MKKALCITQFVWTFLIAMVFLFALCFDSHAAETKINDADATNIVLKNIKKLDDTGSSPRFSPDGKQILFTKITKKRGNKQYGPAIFVMDKDGKNKKVLLDGGYNGMLSPDGTKIAYCVSQRLFEHKLAIYDIKAKKKFELIEIDCSSEYAAWFKDGKSIFWGGGGGDNGIIVNLDTLKTERAQDRYCVEGMGRETVCKADEWIETNLISVAPPKNVWIDAINLDANEEEKEGTFRLPKEYYTLWIGNRDNSFKRPLGVMVKSVNISPDLSKILFEKGACGFGKNCGIYIADMVVAKDKDLPARTFRVPIGIKTLLEESSRRSENGRVDPVNFVDFVNRFMKEGTIYANVSVPKINPLTKKTLGYAKNIYVSDKNWKGLVRFIKIFDDYSIVKVVDEREPVAIGDVVWNLKASIKDVGVYNWDVWAVIEAKAEWKEEIPKAEGQGGEGASRDSSINSAHDN